MTKINRIVYFKIHKNCQFQEDFFCLRLISYFILKIFRLSWVWSRKPAPMTAPRRSSARKPCPVWRMWLCNFCQWQRLPSGASWSRDLSWPATRTKTTANWSRSPTEGLWKIWQSTRTTWRFLRNRNPMCPTVSHQGRKTVYATSFCMVSGCKHGFDRTFRYATCEIL